MNFLEREQWRKPYPFSNIQVQVFNKSVCNKIILKTIKTIIIVQQLIEKR